MEDIFADQLVSSPLLYQVRPRRSGSDADPFADRCTSPGAFPIAEQDIFADDYFGPVEPLSPSVGSPPALRHPSVLAQPQARARGPSSLGDALTQSEMHGPYNAAIGILHQRAPPPPPPSMTSSHASSATSVTTPPPSTPPAPEWSGKRSGGGSGSGPSRWRHSRSLSQIQQDAHDRAINNLSTHIDKILARLEDGAIDSDPSLIPLTIRSFIDTLLYESASDIEILAADGFNLDPETRASLCMRLLDSPAFALPSISSACAALYELAEEECEPERRSLVYELLLAITQFHRAVVTEARERGLPSLWLRDLLEVDDFRTQRLAVALLRQVYSSVGVDPSDLELVDDGLLNRLLDLVEIYGQDAEGPTRILAQQLILLLAQWDFTAVSLGKPRCLIHILAIRRRRARSFEENIISMFIHETSTTSRLHLLSIYSGLFANKDTERFFYTNDLSILLDVLIRDLWDMGEEDVLLRLECLRVLGLVIERTQWPEGRYKQGPITRILTMLRSSIDPGTAEMARRIEGVLEWM